ncbi:PccB3: predcited propionyl-CoA carboxylase, subunit beta [Desulfosarcina variabilis str. Montpellier]|uniref:acyl-CoA carboxylase subunit beta n=1 Tax=Desulfosarcina variabilis TaxID=2300 RepID=UPI003AFACDA6
MESSTPRKKQTPPPRDELLELLQRLSAGMDDQRPRAIQRRRLKGQRTAREYLDDLLDKDSFIEYGALTLAAQRGRKAVDELVARTPADGLITGIGTVNAPLFGDQEARCMVMAYDYTVLAGTQGYFNHKKMDRLLGLADTLRLPLILFTEGGGGRPGDTDAEGVRIAGLDLPTFAWFAGLSGKVPLIGIVSGYCFAGNAALLGCCDVIIATGNANIGMGGPVMIEGGGLGTCAPEDVGPIEVQHGNGVVDIRVDDEAEAVAAAKQYLSYFQGVTPTWNAADQTLLRKLIPENRRRTYDDSAIIQTLVDKHSFLELRSGFGRAMITGLVRIEGVPFGLMANNCQHMAGTIEPDDADKAARFMQLCNAHALPMLSLIDTPGFMVGPDVEKRAQVRHVCRMFLAGSHLKVPFFSIVLRRGYGLGAMAMARGGFHESFFTTAWPTGEFGGMGVEGAVKAAFKKELAAIQDTAMREQFFSDMVARRYANGKALNMAAYMEIDSVIDPADTRKWIIRGLTSLPPPMGEKTVLPYIDSW